MSFCPPRARPALLVTRPASFLGTRDTKAEPGLTLGEPVQREYWNDVRSSPLDDAPMPSPLWSGLHVEVLGRGPSFTP